ncbi:LPS export ABC transporter permease LptF [Sphingomonas morindae]|uniref:LPS export ABC transporter permease LptF n=1 Tax=Sphingomonas morindae TaxID=1541170 RepID=A0ABY4X8D5_9SPHN|nr:LPS export ABC transporter permease LptF [Sphingomonas morindae]USI73197.1 LPS export ABC transporter permease LptF [Sphingomonas morindae]
MQFLTSTDRYLARLIAVPLVSTLILSAMLLLLDKMLRLFDFVVQQGGPVGVVWEMLANTIPEYMSLGIPIGLMLGILLAFRKLALSSELDVFRALGVSYGRLLRVPYLFAIGLALVNLLIVGFVQPYSHYAYEGLRYELRSGALGASIKVGEFTKLSKKETVRIEQSRDGGRELSGIFVRAAGDDGAVFAVTAASGAFFATDDPDTIIFRLHDGVLVQNRPDFRTPRVLSFQSHDLPIALPKIESFRGRGTSQNEELTVPELVRTGLVSPSAKERAESRAEFHFRMVEVAIMMLLPLLAVALAVPPKRSSSALGVFLSIVMIVTYHKVNQYASAVAALGKINPVLALWLPFLVFAGLIWWMYRTLARVPGGQPIGALERAAAKSVAAVQRWARLGRGRVRRAQA